MKRFHLLSFLSIFLVIEARGFVPPLTAVFKAGFDGRKSVPTETVFRHQIQLRSGENIAVEERLAEIGGKIYMIFRSPSYGDVAGTFSKGFYSFTGDKRVASRSRAFISFYTASNADQFREVLIDERLVKRDQFSQYKSSFTPQGDPATWDLKENYVVHPDVYFSKTPQGPAIIAVGTEEGKTRRSVFFDKGTLLLSRIEWRESNQESAWNFRGSKKFPGDSSFPDEMTFTVDGRAVVQSNLISRQFLKGKSKTQWLDKFSSTSKSSMAPGLEEGLRILLGYR
ncbi:MAG: hypothetical protein EBQ92_01420 [Proteobacteria bacterium]|nr:hypothetical protein [Pseudomonadota bacterium]